MTFAEEFRDAFFEESAEHVASIEQGLLSLDRGLANADQLHAIFRAAHSIKGLAGTLGFGEVAAFTHDMESLLDQLRSGVLDVTPERTKLLLRANDTLKDLLDASRADAAASVDTVEVTAALRSALGNATGGAPGAPGTPGASEGQAGPRTWSVRLVPAPELFAAGQDPMLVVRELAELGDDVSVVCDTSRLPALDALDPEQCQLTWIVKVTTSATRDTIAQSFLFIEDVCEYSIRDVTEDPARAGVAAHAPPLKVPAPDARPAAPEQASIRVPTDKIDALVDLVGELVIAQAMVNQIAADFDLSRLQALKDALQGLDRSTRDLQERVMSVRMLPVATVFNRFPRLVRDVSDKLGKQVRLDTQGAETELDKGMIERIGDPLTHLVRNAIDHGLELPADRERAGKAPMGTVTLRAFHEGGSVVIEVADDGRGLNTSRIREKALAQGLIRAEDSLTDDEINALIFAPGFSTASQVSDLSGRGVGMDVVKRNVEGMSGSVNVHSVAGQGSTVRIRLPLTLAILDGLVIGVGGATYVLPLLSVVETLRPRPSDVRTILGSGEVLMVRGESLPFVRLHDVFGHADAVTEPSLGIVVIAETDGRRFGLLVDDVLGQQQVVIKSLESNYRKLDSIMGATILGDGRVSLICDVQDLFRFTTSRRDAADHPGGPALVGAPQEDALA